MTSDRLAVEGLRAPSAQGEEAAWYDALKQERLTYSRCGDCGHPVLPIRVVCPVCGSTAMSIQTSLGRGRIYTYTIQYRRPAPDVPVPNVIAMVDFDEGFRLLTRVCAVEPEAVRVDLPVEVRYAELDDYLIPVVVPVSGETA